LDVNDKEGVGWLQLHGDLMLVQGVRDAVVLCADAHPSRDGDRVFG
jgi:hypothetical protein